MAIEVEPRYADSWKRRGQARSALGDSEGALADLQRAIDLAPLFGGADSATVRGHSLLGHRRGGHKRVTSAPSVCLCLLVRMCLLDVFAKWRAALPLRVHT